MSNSKSSTRARRETRAAPLRESAGQVSHAIAGSLVAHAPLPAEHVLHATLAASAPVEHVQQQMPGSTSSTRARRGIRAAPPRESASQMSRAVAGSLAARAPSSAEHE